MTSSTDRWHRITRYDNSAIRDAITETIHGQKNQRIMRSLFLDGQTYEQVAEQEAMTPRGLYYRVGRISDPLEARLKKLN